MPGSPQVSPREMVQILQPYFQRRDESQFAWKSLVSSFMAIPGLRALWPMSSVYHTAASQARDVSGSDNHLTNNNAALLGYDTANSLVPLVDLNGTTQYLSRADGGANNWADITGTEAYVPAAQRGLTFGMWMGFDNAIGVGEFLFSKWAGAGTFSYHLYRGGGGFPTFRISSTGNNAFLVVSTKPGTHNERHFIVCRFNPATPQIDIFVDPRFPADFDSNAAGIPASIFPGTAPVVLGGTGLGTTLLNGKIGITFLSACACSDALIFQLYEQSRTLFNRV